MTNISIKDVAAFAGVSIGTVSNVLNRPELVKAATRQRVERAIDELQFVPNGSARQLKAGQSTILGYLMLDASNPFFTDVARGVKEIASANGLSLFLCESGQSRDAEERYLRDLAELRVRGVLLTPIDAGAVRLNEVGLRDIPVVMVDQVFRGDSPPWCSVGVDDLVGGEMAVEHLIERGHSRIGFVGGPIDLPQVADRLSGANLAVTRAGLDQNAIHHINTATLTAPEGRSAGERLLGMPRRRRPTAVFCANDLLAVGLLQYLTQQGLAVPDDVAIIGYDDIDYASAAAVPLSSVAQPRHQMGQEATRLLLAEANGGPKHRHRSTVLLPELVARASTGA